ncbi:MAG: hypothetical protein E7313_04715 [Clostridiales bacterium]|nr:hypothetical protein [Clostridiales bacterium]
MENAKKKHTGSNILIILLILIILTSTGVGLYSWAKYRTTIEGTATGEIAKWNFNVTDGNSQTEAIDFTLTRTDNNDSVVDGKLAPGTCGELEIEIDATGTETALTYVIEGEMSNLPTNLKLYSNEERTEELIVVNNKFSYGKYMSLQEIGKKEEKIYWEWPFETGTTTEEKTANNKIDTEDNEKTMNMNITVTGKQVNGEPRLADLVQVGDYVNYDADSNGTYTFTNTNYNGTSIESSVSTEQDFDSNAKSQWRVLSVDRKTGMVDLIAVAPSTQKITLTDGDIFSNTEEILKNVGAIYGHGKGANGGRSVEIEDIEQYSTYNPSTMYNNGNYNRTMTYTNGTFYKQTVNENGQVTGFESTLTEASTENPVTIKQTFYYYTAKQYFTNSTIYNMIFKNNNDGNNISYLVASRSVTIRDDNECCYFIFNIWDAGVRYTSIIHSSNGSENATTISSKIRPVVSLNTNIQTTGQNADGVWQLKVE